ncbi:MAG: NUDIX domain-containing protein [Nanoarchaeota archaeon]|mgnify:CR=1 FL=1
MGAAKTRVRVGVILIDDGRVLVVRMHRDTGDIYVLPGGGLDHGENIMECAVREAREEANVDINVERILYLKELFTDTEHGLEIDFLGSIVGGSVRKGFDPEEKGKNVLKEVVWVPLGALPTMNFHPKQLRERLARDVIVGFKDCPVYLGRHQYPE